MIIKKIFTRKKNYRGNIYYFFNIFFYDSCNISFFLKKKKCKKHISFDQKIEESKKKL
jgi:hypothetical protein